MGLFEKKDGFSEKQHVKSRLVYGNLRDDWAPKISILMPVYNHPQYFEKALQSALSQICDFEYEIIVCDNNHPDFQIRNQEIAEKYACKKLFYYVNEENIGGLSNWNRCIELANADDVTFCHDDDLLDDKCLDVLNSARVNTNSNIAVFGRYNSIDKNGCIISKYKLSNLNQYNTISLKHLLFRNYTNGCGALYNRHCLLSIGGFVGDYNPCPDYYLNTKYAYYYGALLLGTPTFFYRRTDSNDSASCYAQIGKAATKIRQEIITKLDYPNCFLVALAHSLSISDDYFNYKSWTNSVKGILRFRAFGARIFIWISKRMMNIEY